MPAEIASNNPEHDPYDPTMHPEYTVCCNLPMTMVDSCACPVLVIEEDISDFDKAHSKIDIYDSSSDCLSCDNYYQVTCPAFRKSLVDFKTYNTMVDKLISKCDNYVYYKDIANNNYESAAYYD
jgi:hypothetical protein